MPDRDTEAIRAALRRSEGFTASSASEAFLALNRLVARLEAAERDVALCAADTTAADLAQDVEFLKAEREQLRGERARAVYLAQHLFEMIDRDTWRASGGDDGQGHYEGHYRAERIEAELAALAAAAPGETTVTHGRHCPCSACAREDWTRITGPCGMHGADCPAVYAPAAPGETERTP